MLTHKREQSFGCELCDKKFTETYSLIAHMSIHMEEKHFCCKVCED